ncbi:MAG: hypothetical protein IAF38_16015 [Bacteroidia bacterium]|nr:hypothetical protein [Bacteroidia bacterium]
MKSFTETTLSNYKKLTLALTFFLLVCTTTKAQTARFTLAGWQTRASAQSNLLPMYGQKPKTEKELQANKEFLQKMGLGKSQSYIRYRSDVTAESGWKNYYAGALDTAMFRFNQAWLIDSTNSGPYIGFSTIYSTLGDSVTAGKMLLFVQRNDTLSKNGFHEIIKQNRSRFRKIEEQQFKVLAEYKPVSYYASGQLFIERKKAGRNFHYKWYYENGNLLREVYGGEDPHDWKGEVISYHDNGKIAHKGQWKKFFLRTSVWTSYDRDGKISKIEYWRKKPLSSTYNIKKTITYKQGIPQKK